MRATYDPTDDKLRLYADSRLGDDDYAKAKARRRSLSCLSVRLEGAPSAMKRALALLEAVILIALILLAVVLI